MSLTPLLLKERDKCSLQIPDEGKYGQEEGLMVKEKVGGSRWEFTGGHCVRQLRVSGVPSSVTTSTHVVTGTMATQTVNSTMCAHTLHVFISISAFYIGVYRYIKCVHTCVLHTDAHT